MAIFYSCVKLPEVSMNQNWETPSWRFVPGGEGQWPTCWVSQKKTHVGRLLFVFQGFQVFIFQGDGLWIWNPRYSKVFQNVWFLNFLECQRYVHQHSPCYLSDQQSFRGPKVLSMCKCFEKDEKVRNRLVQLFIIPRSPKLLVSVIVSNPFCFFSKAWSVRHKQSHWMAASKHQNVGVTSRCSWQAAVLRAGKTPPRQCGSTAFHSTTQIDICKTLKSRRRIKSSGQWYNGSLRNQTWRLCF